jgi:hypothetical protein
MMAYYLAGKSGKKIMHGFRPRTSELCKAKHDFDKPKHPKQVINNLIGILKF